MGFDVDHIIYHYFFINYDRDRSTDTSKAGAGRVAMHKLTSILHSYTFESNYATGRCYNIVPPLPVHKEIHDVNTTLQQDTPSLYTQNTYREVSLNLGMR